MKVNWKVRFKFVKSLRFRILVILIIIGIVPSIIVEKGIVNSYEDRAVSNRQLNVKNQRIRRSSGPTRTFSIFAAGTSRRSICALRT